MTAVLEFDVHAGPKLLEIKPAPIDADGVADATGLLDARSARLGHRGVNGPNPRRYCSSVEKLTTVVVRP